MTENNKASKHGNAIEAHQEMASIELVNEFCYQPTLWLKLTNVKWDLLFWDLLFLQILIGLCVIAGSLCLVDLAWSAWGYFHG